MTERDFGAGPRVLDGDAVARALKRLARAEDATRGTRPCCASRRARDARRRGRDDGMGAASSGCHWRRRGCDVVGTPRHYAARTRRARAHRDEARANARGRGRDIDRGRARDV